MKKNKIITLILVSAVCFSLILSLCSFTTSTTYVFDVFEGHGYTVDVGYAYHRQTATIDKLYYGYIPSFNRIASTSPEQYACDYIMTGTKSLDYTDVVFTPSTGYADVTLATDDNTVSYLTGNVQINGLFKYGDIHNLRIAFENTNDEMINFNSSNSMSVCVYAYYYDINTNTVYSTNGLTIDGTFSNVGDELIASELDVQALFRSWLSSANTLLDFTINNLSYLYISRISIEVDSSSLYSSYNYIQVKDYLYNDTVRGDYKNDILTEFAGYSAQANYDEGYNKGFEIGRNQGQGEGYADGYNIGYNKGLNDAPALWGSVGAFFENTVGSFMEFEFIPNISIGGVLSIFVGAALLLAFLKVFAGG